jgi:large subunit ribosomal protein L6e
MRDTDPPVRLLSGVATPFSPVVSCVPPSCCTGPYALNGVPLRRVNQAYVIATSASVDVSGVKIPENLNDAYFARPKEAEKKDEATFLTTDKAATTVSDSRKADQKAVDDQLIKAIAKVDQLDGYLKARFSLKKGQKPHELKF